MSFTFSFMAAKTRQVNEGPSRRARALTPQPPDFLGCFPADPELVERLGPELSPRRDRAIARHQLDVALGEKRHAPGLGEALGHERPTSRRIVFVARAERVEKLVRRDEERDVH